MSKVKRVYVEKKPEYAVKAKELSEELTEYLNLRVSGLSRRFGFGKKRCGISVKYDRN